MAAVKARVCVVTAGHLTTCPRMLKAADALAADYDVRVVSARHTPWAAASDDALARSRAWRWTVVDYRSDHAPAAYAWTGVRHRLARRWAAPDGANVAAPIAARAFGRVHSELVKAILAEPADLIYGGTTGALAAVADAADRQGVPYGLDLEDFHAAEHSGGAGDLDNRLAHQILSRVLKPAACLTTSSRAMADAYTSDYGVEPVVVHNTFPLPAREPVRGGGSRPLRCYWFSQTIGAARGLEDFVAAAGEADIPCELTLRGNAAAGYLPTLVAAGARTAPRLTITHLQPAPPDAMIDECRAHDIGIGLEQMDVRNRGLALSNKVLTYPLAGLALMMTDTPGQRELSDDVPGAIVARPGDVAAIAAGLQRWGLSRASLVEAQASAWERARRRWHWEHDAERGALRAAVASAIEVRV